MKRWLQLIAGICLFICFIKMFPPLFKSLPHAYSILKLIEEREIDASALFYTEEPHTNDAYKNMSKKIRENDSGH